MDELMQLQITLVLTSIFSTRRNAHLLLPAPWKDVLGAARHAGEQYRYWSASATARTVERTFLIIFFIFLGGKSLVRRFRFSDLTAEQFTDLMLASQVRGRKDLGSSTGRAPHLIKARRLGVRLSSWPFSFAGLEHNCKVFLA